MNEYTKNVIIAAGLSMLFIGAWDYFYAFPKLERERAEQLEQHKAAQPPHKPVTATATPEAARPAPAAQPQQQQRPAVAPKTREAALAESPRVSIDTPAILGSISLKGGRIDDVSLKNYRETVDPKSPMIVLLSPENSPNPYYAETGFLAPAGGAPALPNGETLWTADRDRLTVAEPVTLTHDNGQGLTFKRRISVDQNYMFTVSDSVENHRDAPVSLYSYTRVARVGIPQSAGYAILHEGFIGVVGESAVQEMKYDKIEKEPRATKTMSGTGGWIGFTDKYWAAVAVPQQDKPFEARFSAAGAGTVKAYQADTVGGPLTIAPGATQSVSERIFAGAKVVDTLYAYQAQGIEHFDLLIDWGWFYFLTRPMFRIIDSLYHVLGNFGLAILAVTVLVKIAFLPIANKSYHAIAKMKEVQPKLQALKDKYGDDKQKLAQEQMALYKREKINPAGGCLPALLQIPVWFSLYKVLVITIEMRHAPFYGWIKDLSAPDPTNIFNLFGLLPFDPTQIPVFGPFLWLGVLPILMGVSMWATMKMNPEPTDEIQRMAFAWMPVIFTFSMGGFASGLIIYWTWNNILSVAQQGFIMRRAGVKFELWDNVKKTFSFKKKAA
ncbi:membrane protein insertase YidC [Methylosinus sp. Sm6]|uniref:membrane protein insertase YidC n=1 Tax=Methylosinus sp. Sm6 TaxID=2866948 RepID=UPI001C990C66|nr:membrane protein insertase YidC [Methylosinus sp. Sm6]MBY6239960.1 membrane protein insertase YidC [Methylosinus sp. Sm6]